jgi:hypothetical protein
MADADDIQSSDINWQNVRITHGKTDYFDEIHATKPKSHILFSAHFTNDTDQTQVYSVLF